MLKAAVRQHIGGIMKKILITGGAGFIGSHLCELLSKGNKVICADNLSTGRKENIKDLPVEFIKQDITEKFDIPCEQIYNMASPASPIDYQKLSLETLLVGSNGVKNVLDNAVKYKARVLHASTSEVYGDPLEHPQKEEHWGNVNPIGPRSCYDEAKRYAEALCMAYYRTKSLSIVIPRIFNTYGPKMRIDDGRLLPNLVGQALRGEPMTIYGDGKQTRSFCYVGDLTLGLVGLMNSKYSGEVFNLGNPSEYTVLEFAMIVKKQTGTKSEIKFGPLPGDDPKRRKPDITKVRRGIGWEPKVQLEEGIKMSIPYIKRELEGKA